MKDFKPIKQEKLNTSIRIDTEMLNVIDEEAMKIGISRNEFIVQCIEYALNNMDK